MRKFILLLIVVFLSASVIAQEEVGAKWIQVDIKSNWQQTSTGFCRELSQCLVSNSFSEVFDNIPDSYWDGLSDPDLGPKCIANGQSILDNYCNEGIWSSRTRLIATQLLGIALKNSPYNFSLYCDSFDVVLNDFKYAKSAGQVVNFLGRFCAQEGFAGARFVQPCVNSMCALKYGKEVLFGTSLNSPIDGPKSFLFALDLPGADCAVAVNDDGDFDYCGDGVWYNWNTNSILFAQGVAELPNPQILADDFFMVPFNKIKDYVFSVVHKPEIVQFNYSFFRQTPQFSQVYMSKEGTDFVYAFKQKNVTLTQLDFAGWYLSNIDLPSDSCVRLIKRFDTRANCEKQPSSTEFYVVAHKNPPLVRTGTPVPSIVDSWSDTTGRLRVVR